MNSRLCAAIVLALPLAAGAAPETYTFDPPHTITHFEVSHFGFTNIRGRFDRNAGKFTIDRAARSGGLDMTVQTNSVNTGDSDRGSRPRTRDEHLRTPDFFNVAEFPTMAFKSTAVKFSGESPDVVEGNLTMIGVTRPVSLKLDSWRCGPHPVSKREMCGGVATTTIKRSDWGMKYGIPALGDDVKLWMSFEAYRD